MEFLVRFVQRHENFRIAELKSLAALNSIDMPILDYRSDVRLEPKAEALGLSKPATIRAILQTCLDVPPNVIPLIFVSLEAYAVFLSRLQDQSLRFGRSILSC